MNADHTRLLPGVAPCPGCGIPRHPTVGKVPCPGCGHVCWTLAVTGSRSLADQPARVLAAARTGLARLQERMGSRPILVLHGDAPGADRILATRLAAAGRPVQPVPADWDRHGRRAGLIRNRLLIVRSAALLAIWDGRSPGTAHTLGLAQHRGRPVACHTLDRTTTPPPPRPLTEPERARTPASSSWKGSPCDPLRRADPNPDGLPTGSRAGPRTPSRRGRGEVAVRWWWVVGASPPEAGGSAAGAPPGGSANVYRGRGPTNDSISSHRNREEQKRQKGQHQEASQRHATARTSNARNARTDKNHGARDRGCGKAGSAGGCGVGG